VFADGEHAMKTALQELEEAGHLQRVLGNRSTGFDHQWVVYEDLVECPNTACSTEEPIGRFSASGESTSEEPISGKPPSIKKNNSKKNNSKKTTREGGVAPTAADLVEMRQMLNDVDWDDLDPLTLWKRLETGDLENKPVRSPLAYLRSLANRGELSGYLGACAHLIEEPSGVPSIPVASGTESWAAQAGGWS
jgi:hypothetical protein